MDDKKLVDRRRFFKSVFVEIASKVIEFTVDKGQMSREARGYVRPPGAVEEELFISLCTKCNECIKVCPHYCIRGVDSDTGAGIGTPIMIPEKAACESCPDQPCIKVCKDGALRV